MGESGHNNQSHFDMSVGRSCGGIGDDDPGGKSPVAPFPEPGAFDACVVIRFAAAEGDSGGKSSVAPLPEPDAPNA